MSVHTFTAGVTRLLIFAVISPELLDVDHGVHAASLVDPPDCGDALVLCVRAHSLAEGDTKQEGQRLRVS